MSSEETKARSRREFQSFKQRHPEKVKEWGSRNHRNRLYKNKYGITADEFDAMIVAQDNRCPVGNHLFGPLGRHGNSPALDHCHTTGKIRMVLCRNHNAALGMFNDSVEELQSAIEYLMRFADAAKRLK